MEQDTEKYPTAEVGPVDLRQARITAVLNSGSGHCDDTAEETLKAVVCDAGLSHTDVFRVTPADVDEVLREAIEKSDVVIVLGGDGTIRAAAEACESRPVFLVPLPGGTMNMLPKALYGEAGWKQALAATLAKPEVREVSGGKAEGHAFFCVAILGAPSLWADAREALRAGDLSEAAKRSLTAARRSLGQPIDYSFGDGEEGSAEAVAVICPAVSAAMPFDERALEAAALDPRSAAEALRLAVHAASDGWRRDPSVTVTRTRTIRVRGHGRVPVILDGEKVRMGRTVNIVFNPVAFRALVPAAAGSVIPPR